MGRPLGILGETLRFHSHWPEHGPLLVPFAEVEAIGLIDCLRACTAPGDGPGILAIARVAAVRGLVEPALRDLDRALRVDAALEPTVRRMRAELIEEAAGRGLRDAREHMDAGRIDHARAALEDTLARFPQSAAAAEARTLRRNLASTESRLA